MSGSAFQKIKDKYNEYPDDIFKETRMPLGEHIEELRYRLIVAMKWLGFFLVIGFVLDAIGNQIGNKNIGIGQPMLAVIKEPVQSQTRDFYLRRTMKIEEQKMKNLQVSDAEDVAIIREKLKRNDYNLDSLSREEKQTLLGSQKKVRVTIDPRELEAHGFVLKPEASREPFPITQEVSPAEISILSDEGQAFVESRQYLTTLSAQEAVVVYFKVSLLCGVVLASPFILYQFWAFVGAGLYPHEKRYVYLFFGPSVGLFIAGVLLCQFVVLPGAVRALLKFNELLDLDPDIRLNEWLSLAIILPLVFGVSFQTPLVMVFLNRIGLFTAQDYLSKWRYACIILAIVAMVITPTPDVITMLYMFVPMFGLYLIGTAVCYYFPGFDPNEEEEVETSEEVAV